MKAKSRLLICILMNIAIYGLYNYLFFTKEELNVVSLTFVTVFNGVTIYGLSRFVILLLPSFKYLDMKLSNNWIYHGIIFGVLWGSFGHLTNINSSTPKTGWDIYHYYVLGIAHLMFGLIKANQFIAIGPNKIKIQQGAFFKTITRNQLSKVTFDDTSLVITHADQTTAVDLSSMTKEKMELLESELKL